MFSNLLHLYITLQVIILVKRRLLEGALRGGGGDVTRLLVQEGITHRVLMLWLILDVADFLSEV
jgi:hypothetical protein